MWWLNGPPVMPGVPASLVGGQWAVNRPCHTVGGGRQQGEAEEGLGDSVVVPSRCSGVSGTSPSVQAVQGSENRFPGQQALKLDI